ncbi:MULTISPECIES: lasso peptide biosynthesis B2 protein [Streptomyces]|uniref:lasso peptide biosynthesis B2 protein n=1 Tax=Streptomyces TaxID=1883 RepID=UPI00345B7973
MCAPGARIWPDWCTGVRTAPFRAHAWLNGRTTSVRTGAPYCTTQRSRIRSPAAPSSPELLVSP